MSLILQALKKAEAERELGRVPTLASGEPPDERPARPRRTLAWGAWGAVAVLTGLLFVWLWPRPAPTPVLAAPPAVMPAPTPAPVAPSAPAPVTRPMAAAAPVQPPAQASKPKPAASAPLPTQDQLPPELQRKLPNLAVTGTIWSASPADRMLMIAGQVLHEGDRITPELQVQSIGPREAVLVVQGTAFRLPY